AIAHYFKEKNIDTKIRFVNRLDRDTTGLVLVAKNKFAHQFIQDQMKGGHVRKKYVAIAQGVIEPEFQTIDLPIGRKSEEDIERVVMKEGKPSVTDCRVVERYRGFSLVELTLKTGRTHQIRVHLKAIGHPLAGDPLYNLDADSHPIDRQALHAESLALVLPRSKRWIALQADLPEDMKRLIAEVKI
ncbi:MAG TPA: RluA family pseudouridine synthase, partial [Eubacteriaceae bacterium]|nr:RluA family pseudouridine synthase [Eubacteriaceae bacterium]